MIIRDFLILGIFEQGLFIRSDRFRFKRNALFCCHALQCSGNFGKVGCVAFLANKCRNGLAIPLDQLSKAPDDRGICSVSDNATSSGPDDEDKHGFVRTATFGDYFNPQEV